MKFYVLDTYERFLRRMQRDATWLMLDRLVALPVARELGLPDRYQQGVLRGWAYPLPHVLCTIQGYTGEPVLQQEIKKLSQRDGNACLVIAEFDMPGGYDLRVADAHLRISSEKCSDNADVRRALTQSYVGTLIPLRDFFSFGARHYTAPEFIGFDVFPMRHVKAHCVLTAAELLAEVHDIQRNALSPSNPRTGTLIPLVS